MGRIQHLQLYVRSMGKLLQIEAVFGTSLDDVADANALMARDSRLAVVAESDGMILLADKYDRGLTVVEDRRKARWRGRNT
jgi:hypothetical protein